HPDDVVVAAAEQRRPRGGTQGRRVEPVVLEAVRGEALSRWRADGPAECAACGEADIVEQDDEDVRGTGWWSDIANRRKAGRRVLRVVRGEPDVRLVGDRQDRSAHLAQGVPQGMTVAPEPR